jgi:putative glycosyltransferase (TIGR04372 family)
MKIPSLQTYSVAPFLKSQVNIFCALLHSPLGNFVDHVLYCASVKELIKDAYLDVYYRPDRPYKEKIISMADGIDAAWPVVKQFPLGMFNSSSHRSVRGADEWYQNGSADPNLFLVPSMCTFNDLAALPRITRLRVPESDRYDEELRRLIGPGWFVIFHYREPGYEFRPNISSREANMDQIPKIIDRIIHLGGQAVRIGHPEMTDFEPRPGFIDLKNAEFFLQAQAVARARCFLEISGSGPASLAQAQGVPQARCNLLDVVGAGVRPELGFVAPKRVITRSGEDVTRTLIEMNKITRKSIESSPDFEFRELSLRDIFDVLDHLLEFSKNSTHGWRDVSPVPPLPPIDGFYPGRTMPVPVSILL